VGRWQYISADRRPPTADCRLRYVTSLAAALPDRYCERRVSALAVGPALAPAAAVLAGGLRGLCDGLCAWAAAAARAAIARRRASAGSGAGGMDSADYCLAITSVI